MKKIREVLRKILEKIPGKIPGVLKRYRVATAALAVAVLLVLGFRVYQGIVKPPVPGPQRPISKAVPSAPSPGKSAGPESAPKSTTPEKTTTGTPASPRKGATAGPVKRDLFIPLVSSGGGVPLPPVPSLSPGGPLTAGGLPVGDLRVVGIIWDTGAVAIVVDARGSYVVEAGDEIGPDMQVERIDARRGVVAVRRGGVVEELTMRRGGIGQ